MKVRELINLLEKQDGEQEVLTEGCDCNGRADGVELVVKGWASPYIIITRGEI